MSEQPKQITYIEHEHKSITIHDIYEITPNPEEATCYVITPTGSWGMKLARREITK